MWCDGRLLVQMSANITKRQRIALAEDVFKIWARVDDLMATLCGIRKQQADKLRRAQLEMTEVTLLQAWHNLDSAARYLMSEPPKSK